MRRFFPPTRIIRYILGELALPFAAGLAFILFLLLMFQVLRLSDLLIVHGVSVVLIAQMLSLLVVTALPYAILIAFLSAVLVAMGRLSLDQELVAFNAVGVGTSAITRTIVAFSFSASLAVLALNFEWSPRAEKAFTDLVIRVGNSKVVKALQQGAFTTGFFDLLVFTERIEPGTNEMKNVFIYDERDPKSPFAIVAKRGSIFPIRSKMSPGDPLAGRDAGVLLRLNQGAIHSQPQEQASDYQRVDFGAYHLLLETNDSRDTSGFRPRFAPISRLLNEGTHAAWAEVHRRVAIAISPIIFGILGIAFGVSHARSPRAGAMTYTAVFVTLYWTLLALSMGWAESTKVPPWILYLFPNAVLGAVAWWGYRRKPI